MRIASAAFANRSRSRSRTSPRLHPRSPRPAFLLRPRRLLRPILRVEAFDVAQDHRLNVAILFVIQHRAQSPGRLRFLPPLLPRPLPLVASRRAQLRIPPATAAGDLGKRFRNRRQNLGRNGVDTASGSRAREHRAKRSPPDSGSARRILPSARLRQRREPPARPPLESSRSGRRLAIFLERFARQNQRRRFCHGVRLRHLFRLLGFWRRCALQR